MERILDYSFDNTPEENGYISDSDYTELEKECKTSAEEFEKERSGFINFLVQVVKIARD
jgi:hypothetical protein